MHSSKSAQPLWGIDRTANIQFIAIRNRDKSFLLLLQIETTDRFVLFQIEIPLFFLASKGLKSVKMIHFKAKRNTFT